MTCQTEKQYFANIMWTGSIFLLKPEKKLQVVKREGEKGEKEVYYLEEIDVYFIFKKDRHAKKK